MIVVLTFLALLGVALRSQAAEPAPLTLDSIIPLPGIEGRFDHAAIDAGTHRLFFAALGNDTVEVVDVVAGKRLHTITGIKKPTGVVFLPDSNTLIVASGGDGACHFYDGNSYAERGRVTGLADADNLRFDARARLVYVGYGDGAIGVIDPTTMRLTASIPLAKHPESFQLESKGERLFVNVPDANQIAVVDRAAGKVVATWPIRDVRANFPMALDEAHHHLVVGCREPARLLVFDTQSGMRIGETTMSGDVDDLFFDSTGSRLFASCGEGFVDVFEFSASAKLARTHRIAGAVGARTSFFSTQLDALYLAVPHRGAQAAEIRVLRPSAK
jgi:DNA-binding beta-propeller fold protein YncE